MTVIRTESHVRMSPRLDKSWAVVASYQTPEADRWVDVSSYYARLGYRPSEKHG